MCILLNVSTLYIVATPIGNLEDLSYRAARILKEVRIVAAEDTRQSRKLLNSYNIHPETVLSCRAWNEKESAKGLVKLLDEGYDIAYVSDAGTPGISDPGKFLVNYVRDTGHLVVPLPGASAVTTLVSVAGFGGKGYIFEGFLSPKAGRRLERLKKLLESGFAFVLYESPYRIVKLLEVLATLVPKRKIFLGREMTKKHEEFWLGKAEEAFIEWNSRKNIKGEFTLIVENWKKD